MSPATAVHCSVEGQNLVSKCSALYQGNSSVDPERYNWRIERIVEGFPRSPIYIASKLSHTVLCSVWPAVYNLIFLEKINKYITGSHPLTGLYLDKITFSVLRPEMSLE